MALDSCARVDAFSGYLYRTELRGCHDTVSFLVIQHKQGHNNIRDVAHWDYHWLYKLVHLE